MKLSYTDDYEAEWVVIRLTAKEARKLYSEMDVLLNAGVTKGMPASTSLWEILDNAFYEETLSG